MKFIDDLVETIGKEVGKVQARSEEMLKVYNLNQEIKELEEQKTNIFIEIGHLIYDKYQNQKDVSEESLKEKCAEIKPVESDIAKLQTQLEKLKAQSKARAAASNKTEPKQKSS